MNTLEHKMVLMAQTLRKVEENHEAQRSQRIEAYKEELRTYVKKRTAPSPFLSAVLRNDLSTAVLYASLDDILLLRPLIYFCRWHVPAPALGS